MAPDEPKRTPRKMGQTGALSLLVAGVVSAGLLAYVTRGTNSSSKGAAVNASDEPGAVERQAVGDRGHDGGSHADRPAEAERGFVREIEPVAVERVSEIEVPSETEALEMRRPDEEPSQAIVDRGLAAIMKKPVCEGPAQLVDSALGGVGTWGCVIESPAQSDYLLGRAGHRKRNGNLEVGEYENGRRTGEWEQYYPTGILAAKGSFVDGQRDGVWHEYDEDGRHRVSRSYKEGRKHGVTVRFSEEVAAVDLYFEGGAYDPETKEPVLVAEVAEAR